MGLYVTPVELKTAQAFVGRIHRHHQPPQGHRFSLGLWHHADNELHGVLVAGRPVARLAGHPCDVLEVTRLATDGIRNGCSILYAAAARAAAAMGFISIQTYILDTELGTSLRAAGWTYFGPAGGGQWHHTDGKERRTDQPTGIKGKWVKILNERPSARHTHTKLLIDPQERLL